MSFMSKRVEVPGCFNTPPWICAIFLIVFAIPSLLYTSYTLNYQNENGRIDESAKNITHDIDKRLTEIRTILGSLVGLYYASEKLEDNELMLFSRELRAQNPFISGIGRYEQIFSYERDEFESRMSERGLLNFKLTEIDETGYAQASQYRDYYYPTSSLEPRSPANLKLLGADLGASHDLRTMIDDIAANNETLISTFPDSWQAGSDLLLFRPVYRGNRAPTTKSVRVKQLAGGFWISIDLAGLIAAINPNIKNFDLRVDIADDAGIQTVYAQASQSQASVFLTGLYPRTRFNMNWDSHIRSLNITLQQSMGYTTEALVYTLISLISVLLTSLLLTVHVVATKKAMLDQKASQDVIYEEREKAETTLNSVQDAIITLDADMRVVYVNSAAIVRFNATLADTIGQNLTRKFNFEIVGEENRAFDMEAALSCLVANDKGEFDVVSLGQSQSDFIMRMTLTRSFTGDGVVMGHVIVLRDISHERRLTNRLAYQAHHDSLTGCTNRFYFEQKLAGLLEDLPSTVDTHALCYLDLDQFKVINDTCGHQAGDRLLTELTQNMHRVINETDVLSRLGGDEFGILMINVTREEATEISQRVYNFFQNYVFHHEDKSFAVRASIGMVHIDQTCENMKDVLAWADIACYAAKDSGRNSMHVYSSTDEMLTERSMELGWLPRLQNALQNDEFRLHVQAVASVNPQHGIAAIEHFEFLLRLSNPDGSDSTPWQFIQAAERYDLMRDIDKWVIRNALLIMAQLHGSPADACSFSINLSGQSAADPNLKDYIREQMQYYAIDPSRIWFELTETAAISHFAVAIELITSIREMGCKVALDDFGSGLSSFGYLKSLPVDVIKIDGQFVREIAANEIDREMVKAIHQVGRSMGIQTVAEFVENQEILDTLKDIGIDYAQGYHIGKPCSVEVAVGQLAAMFQRAA